MTNKKFIAIWTPILAVLLVIAIGGTYAADYFAETLDYQLGGGGVTVVDSGSFTPEQKDYYGTLGLTSAQAAERTEALARQINDEGTVLLKNNGVLPLEKGTAVTPFGYGYLNPVYSGLGAGASNSAKTVSPEDALRDYFTVNTAAADAMRASSPQSPEEAPGTIKVRGDSGTLLHSDQELREYDPAIYSGITSGLPDTTALVYITRTGQEGADKKYDGYADGTPHYFALSANERETIRFAKANCGKVVVILVTSNVMEVGELMEGELEADAILAVGNPGPFGFESLSRLLVGETVPSGRTVDIWPKDFTKDPTYQNFGAFSYTNASWSGSPRNFIEYEEGVYLGYRYYETAQVEDPNFNYADAVVFPFGYGLSYADLDGGFRQEIISFDDAGDDIRLTVRVTNDSKTYSGKEVVQVYFSAPYTAFDIERKIEKPAVNLVEFEKTGLLTPGESQEVEIAFAKEDMASYCYTRDNGDGTWGSYVLEEGDYMISVRGNSHEVLDERTVHVDATVWYDGANPRRSEAAAQSEGVEQGAAAAVTAAANRFQDSSDYMADSGVTLLSRADWTGTFPTRPEGRQKALPDVFLAANDASGSFDFKTDPQLGNVPGSKVYTEEMPASAQENGLTLANFRGRSYYDPEWDALLDQLDWTNSKAQIRSYLYKAAYSLGKLEDVGKTANVVLSDGATGLTSVANYTSFAATPVLASTWNKELMYELGSAIGMEALLDAGGVYGWYSPGLNIHRSPFSARNHEYFSEDAVLTGKMAARLVSGAAQKGVFSFIKHFALNDEETNRDKWLATWATEQAMRETYFRAFELCIKESSFTVSYLDQDESGGWVQRQQEMTGGLAMMVSQACIGTESAMTHYGLLHDMVRGEWGFNGVISTDLYYGADWISDKMVRCGADIYLGNTLAKDYDSATGRSLMRESIKRTLWVTANSGYLQGMTPSDTAVQGTAPWRIALVVFDVVIGVFVAAMAGVIIWRLLDTKKHPERYAGKGKK